MVIDKLNTVYVELTTRCNLSCVMCFRHSMRENSGDMEPELFRKVAREAAEVGAEKLWLGGWGEPVFHQGFADFINYARRLGLLLSVNTNGLLLDRDLSEELVKVGVEKVTVSVDAAVPLLYKEIRGGDYATLAENLRTLTEIKEARKAKRPILELSFTTMRSNCRDLLKIVRLAHSLGAESVLVSNILPTTAEMVDEACYVDPKLAERIKEASVEIAKDMLRFGVVVVMPRFEFKTARLCQFVTSGSACITWDGKVAPCYNFLHSYTCFVYGRKKEVSKAVFGDVRLSSLTKVWRSDAYVKFREKVRMFSFPSCTDCDIVNYCYFAEGTETDCWGNSPSCGDCLYARRLILCPH